MTGQVVAAASATRSEDSAPLASTGVIEDIHALVRVSLAFGFPQDCVTEFEARLSSAVLLAT